MENEETREALREWDKEDLVCRCIADDRMLLASAVRREKAEARIVQLEEALRFCRQLFQDIVDECGMEGSLEEVEAINKADAALSGEAPEKEEE